MSKTTDWVIQEIERDPDGDFARSLREDVPTNFYERERLYFIHLAAQKNRYKKLVEVYENGEVHRCQSCLDVVDRDHSGTCSHCGGAHKAEAAISFADFQRAEAMADEILRRILFTGHDSFASGLYEATWEVKDWKRWALTIAESFRTEKEVAA